jgi:butyryl-CoA dehydrogenase
MADIVKVDIAGFVATVTIDRPKALNALNAQTLDELTAAALAIDGDPAVRVVILTGSGEKAFVAGADIAEMVGMNVTQARGFSLKGGQLGDAIERSPRPWIAAVNGFALGGGCELALCCDFIYAAKTARFGQPEVNLGVIPGFGGTQRLLRRVGLAKAKELVFSGDIVNAEEALRIGLADAVFEPAELLGKARAMAEKIASKGPLAHRAGQAHHGPRPGHAAFARMQPGSGYLCLAVRQRRSEGRHAGVPRQAASHVPRKVRDMDFALTEEQQLIQRTARDFASKEVLPQAAKIDEEHRFPKELVKRMAELGFMGVAVPEQWGGAGMDCVSYALAMEEISRACASCGVIMSVNNSLSADPILKFGTDAQKKQWLVPMARGEILGCFGLSEPDAGSDAAAQKTLSRLDGDEWVISGVKNFITNGPNAQVIILFTMSDQAKGNKGITAFIVPMDAKGVQIGPLDKKLGIRGSQSSQIFFDEVRLPKDAVLGEVGGGFKVAMHTLDGGRIGIAAQALGIARACLEDSVAYAGQRKTFGKPIGTHQAIQWKLAAMDSELDAARLLTLRAASLKDRGVKHSAESAMAKLLASDAANNAAREAIQVFGGYGYMQDFPVERHFRDAKITEIYEGTSEIQRLVIAANLLKD